MLGLSLAMTLGNPTLNAGVGVLPSNRTVATLGDSRTAGCYATTVSRSATGFLFWSAALTNQIYDTSADLTKGVSGNTTTQMLARITDVTGSGAGTVILFGSTNDRGSLTAQQSIDNLAAMIAAVRAAGQVAILVPETPRTDLSAPLLAEHLAVRDWCRSQNNPRAGVYVADSWNDLAVGPAYEVADPAFFVDTVHPNASGHYWIGKRLGAVFDRLWPRRDLFALAGNLLTNPTLTGTGGANLNANSTGQVADSWSLAANTNIAPVVVAASKVAGKQQLVWSGTPTAGATVECRLRQDLSLALFSVGDMIEAIAEVEVDAEGTGMRRAPALEVLYNGGVNTARDGGTSQATDFMPNVAWSGVLRTPAFAFPSGETLIRAQAANLVGIQNVAGAATVRISRVHLRKVI